MGVRKDTIRRDALEKRGCMLPSRSEGLLI